MRGVGAMSSISLSIFLSILFVSGTSAIAGPYGSQIVVHFAPEEPCGQYLEELIDSSTKSIHAAIYNIDLQGVADALIEASNRGVEVQIVADDDQAQNTQSGEVRGASLISYLRDSGIPVVEDEDPDFMHNKFFVIDREVVWTGSTNPTENGVYRNDNDVVVVRSRGIAENYIDEFNEMFCDHTFGGGAETGNPTVIVGGVEVSSYFSPDDGVESIICSELRGATSSVYFMTFCFTSRPIAGELIDLHEQEVEIKGIYETRNINRYSTYSSLLENNISVILDKNPATMHNKLFIIDNCTVITGSFNPSKHANLDNDENILIIRDPEIAAMYAEYFFDRWDAWS